MRFEQRKQGGGTCPRGAPTSWLRSNLAVVNRAPERRGARPYCPLSGTLFPLGTSSPLCQLPFPFLHSCLRTGNVWRPKDTEMPTKPKPSKPNQMRPNLTKMLLLSGLWSHRSFPRICPLGNQFRLGQILRLRSIGRIPTAPVGEGGLKRGRTP